MPHAELAFHSGKAERSVCGVAAIYPAGRRTLRPPKMLFPSGSFGAILPSAQSTLGWTSSQARQSVDDHRPAAIFNLKWYSPCNTGCSRRGARACMRPPSTREPSPLRPPFAQQRRLVDIFIPSVVRVPSPRCPTSPARIRSSYPRSRPSSAPGRQSAAEFAASSMP